jgi:cell division protein FtsB
MRRLQKVFKKRGGVAVAINVVSVPRLFHCTVAGLVIATGLSFLFGASGVFNYRDLRAYESQVTDGIAALQDRHRLLQERAAVLRDNPEALRLLARETGWFRAGETVIEVGPVAVDPAAAGGAHDGREFADVAPLLQRTPPAPQDPFNALALGLFLGVGSFAGLSMARAFRRRRDDQQPSGTAQPDAPAARNGAGESKPPSTPAEPVAPVPAERQEPAPPARSTAEPEAQPAEPRKKARRRRRDVTVYRL